jgi:hypothetical protein
MWERYRKTFLPTQLLIVALCGLTYYVGKAPLPALLLLVVVLEIFGVIGAWWGARLKAKIDGTQNKLPLERR